MENTSNKIKLYNRYHMDAYLEQIDDTNKWELKGEDEVFCHLRIIYDGGHYECGKLVGATILAIDPPGGPYLAKDSFIDNKKIVELSIDPYILTLEEIPDEDKED